MKWPALVFTIGVRVFSTLLKRLLLQSRER